MDLHAYLRSLPDLAARHAFAQSAGTSLGYLRHVSLGTKRPSPALCVALERGSSGAVSRKSLRQDWKSIWPELK